METPEWNKEDKAGSLKNWIQELNEEARVQFLKTGTHIELFFVFNGDGLMELVPAVGMDKDDAVRALKTMLSEREGYGFIHIAEVTARAIDSADKADALLIHAESRDGLSEAWLSAVVMKGEEKMLLDAVRVDGSQIAGRYAGMFE